MNEKITLLFLLSRTRIRKNGKAPIYCRITFLGKRKPFATGLFISPDNWDSTMQIGKPPNEENNHINTQLSLIKTKINQAFLFLQVQQKDFSIDDIYNQYTGVTLNVDKSLMDIFDLHIKKQEKLIGIETTKVSVAVNRQHKVD